MWYYDSRQYKPGAYHEAFHKMVTSPAFAQSWGGFKPGRHLLEARIHGNPHMDTGVIGWEDSVEHKRGENNSIAEALDQVGPEAREWELALEIPDITDRSFSGYVVGLDEPEYVKLGDAGIHERLTSHLADLMALPDEQISQAFLAYRRYFDKIMFNMMQVGFMPPPLLQEILNQRLGLGYEWVGAPPD